MLSTYYEYQFVAALGLLGAVFIIFIGFVLGAHICQAVFNFIIRDSQHVPSERDVADIVRLLMTDEAEDSGYVSFEELLSEKRKPKNDDLPIKVKR
jgi:hypothetical protein